MVYLHPKKKKRKEEEEGLGDLYRAMDVGSIKKFLQGRVGSGHSDISSP